MQPTTNGLKRCIRRCSSSNDYCQCKCVLEAYIINDGLTDNDIYEIDDGMPCFTDCHCDCSSEQNLEFYWDSLNGSDYTIQKDKTDTINVHTMPTVHQIKYNTHFLSVSNLILYGVLILALIMVIFSFCCPVNRRKRTFCVRNRFKRNVYLAMHKSVGFVKKRIDKLDSHCVVQINTCK